MALRSMPSRLAARRYSGATSGRSFPEPSTCSRAIHAIATSAAAAPATCAAPTMSSTCLAKEEDVAAVVVETVRSTDVQVPPPEYYRKLRAACDRHGVLILDEIPVCLGRTGTMFAYEPYGIRPDMVVLGKAWGGGFPMAALIARADLDIAADRALGHYTHEKLGRLRRGARGARGDRGRKAPRALATPRRACARAFEEHPPHIDFRCSRYRATARSGTQRCRARRRGSLPLARARSRSRWVRATCSCSRHR